MKVLMKQYHKIQTVYLRDPETKFKTLLDGQFACPEFDYLQNNTWIGTEKVDGTNIRIMKDGGSRIRIGGKTDNAQMPSHLLSRLGVIGELLDASEIDCCCLYGEGYGAKIQKGGGKYIPDGQDFILFDVKIGDIWLKRKDVIDIARQLDILTVPEIFKGKLSEAVDYVRSGFHSLVGSTEFIGEGLVLRPETELFNRMGQRIITKIKYKDFSNE